MEPFLKWSGNKYPIIDRVKAAIPPGCHRLIEPFVGSGALFANTDYANYILNDANRELVTVYAQLKSRALWYIERCSTYFTADYNQEHVYYELRELYNRTKTPRLFPYMNRHGYHGMYRCNRDGEFNVPYGWYKHPEYPAEKMWDYAAKLQDAELHDGDFEPIIDMAGPGDIVYCDPPYVPLTESANFTAYTQDGFTWADQLRLYDAARRAQGRGAHVLISNHDTPLTQALYQDAEITTFGVHRNMAAASEHRVKAPELLALFRGEIQRNGNQKITQPDIPVQALLRADLEPAY